jgi:hypothetical protein
MTPEDSRAAIIEGPASPSQNKRPTWCDLMTLCNISFCGGHITASCPTRACFGSRPDDIVVRCTLDLAVCRATTILARVHPTFCKACWVLQRQPGPTLPLLHLGLPDPATMLDLLTQDRLHDLTTRSNPTFAWSVTMPSECHTISPRHSQLSSAVVYT